VVQFVRTAGRVILCFCELKEAHKVVAALGHGDSRAGAGELGVEDARVGMVVEIEQQTLLPEQACVPRGASFVLWPCRDYSVARVL
jgi:hypothetical protein